MNAQQLDNAIREIAERDLLENKVFGSAYGVIQDGNTVYKKCFGHTSPDTRCEVTGKTLFRLASMTKPVTAVAALILIDRGLLSLNDPVSKYLPAFGNIHHKELDEAGSLADFGPVRNEITVCHLLTHTSGIGSDLVKQEKFLTDADRASRSAMLEFYCKIGADFEPGTKQSYSATGAFDVLVAVIEKVAKTDFPTFLQREILGPCGMADTTFSPTEEQWERMIKMHDRIDGKNAVGEMKPGCVFEDFPCAHYPGGAGLASTLDDYMKFAEMLLKRGKIGQKTLISEKTMRLMSETYVSKEMMPWNEKWGLSVRVVTEDSYPYLPVGSFGWSGAYGAHFWIDPKNRIAAVFMKNSRVDGGAGNESARAFEKAVYSA